LDIVVWKLGAETAAEASELAQDIFAACATRDLHLALVQLPLSWFQPADCDGSPSDVGLVTCLRSVLMKPEHDAWLERIWERLMGASADVFERQT
jgi:hypothetical protein